MTSRDFCYWLQGFFEIAGNRPCPPEPASCWNLSDSQINMIKNHLGMVFKHEIDPSFGSKDHQIELARAHEGLPDQPSPKTGGVSGPNIEGVLKGGASAFINC